VSSRVPVGVRSSPNIGNEVNFSDFNLDFNELIGCLNHVRGKVKPLVATGEFSKFHVIQLRNGRLLWI